MPGKAHGFLAFLLAPVVGFYLAFALANPVQTLQAERLQLPLDETKTRLTEVSSAVDETKDITADAIDAIQDLKEAAEEEKEYYETHHKKIEQLVAASHSQVAKSEDVLDQILSSMLGDPIGQTFGENATVKVYSLTEAGYRGYMAKVRLHNPNALKVVLANDKVVSNGETTSHAAKRKGAVLAVNAGGFYQTDGKLAVLGTTVVDGKIAAFSTNTNLSFVGFNKNGRLVGGKVTSREQLEQMDVLQGASFLPTLLQDGKRMPIPRDWANTRQPRTMIGHFTNGDLLFIVIDGRRKGWSNGVTLEEAQSKLLEFKVRDAYNLDGGGSSAFYYKGKILNRPSDGRERPVTSNIVVLP
ncbi:phosphodiester glycosidase family protein [Brevibacillus humidisoli]|uniref:phosphodiester glycosidase family protein n=1 Tax=Brevibacillus humidisoli TaxID=2895522 RepID=UPI003B96E8D5